MSAHFARMLAAAGCLVALLQWARARALLRHDALVSLGILAYFLLGTLDIELFSADWSPRLNVTQRVWMVVAIGIWGYLLGAWVGRAHARRAPSARDGPSERLVADSRLLEVVGWVGLVALLVVYSAPALSGANREEQSGYVTTVAQLLIPAYLLRLAASRALVPRGVWVRACLAGLGLLASGHRTYILVLMLGLAIVWFVQQRTVLQRVRAAVLCLALFLAIGIGFGYWRFLREGNESGRELIGSVFGPDAGSALQVAAGFTYVGFFREGPSILGFLVERHPRLEPYTKGRALWGTITSPLPGQQWDARAIVSKEVYGVRQTSLVSTIFGPWYLDFGFVGVLLGLAVLGYVLSRLEEGALTKKSHVHQAAYAYGLVLVGLSIHTGLSDFVFAVLIPAVFLWAARSPGAPAAAPEGVASESGQGHS